MKIVGTPATSQANIREDVSRVCLSATLAIAKFVRFSSSLQSGATAFRLSITFCSLLNLEKS